MSWQKQEQCRTKDFMAEREQRQSKKKRGSLRGLAVRGQLSLLSVGMEGL